MKVRIFSIPGHVKKLYTCTHIYTHTHNPSEYNIKRTKALIQLDQPGPLLLCKRGKRTRVKIKPLGSTQPNPKNRPAFLWKEIQSKKIKIPRRSELFLKVV